MATIDFDWYGPGAQDYVGEHGLDCLNDYDPCHNSFDNCYNYNFDDRLDDEFDDEE